MSFPLEYGNSLVGHVVEVGSEVDASAWRGKRVFCFAAHGTEAVVDVGAAMLVPEGISAANATFMPRVEPAVSLVQEMALVLGERVRVVGAGLIGSLVGQVLVSAGYVAVGDVVLLFVSGARLAGAAAVCNAVQDGTSPVSTRLVGMPLDGGGGSSSSSSSTPTSSRQHGRISTAVSK